MEEKHKHIRNQFTPSEDILLRRAVAMYGSDWARVASVIENRSARQCKERYETYLDPNVVLSDWTDIEDQLIMNCVKQFGRQWRNFPKFFRGRTPIAIKNRYNVLYRREKRKERKLNMPSTNGDTSLETTVEPPKKKSNFDFIDFDEMILQFGADDFCL